MYSNDTKVLHLGDVASTGTNLVHTARANGRSWALRNLPAAPSLTSLSAWARRGTDALRYLSDGTKPELQHIHYGPNGYYGWLKDAPYVLHLHGTDLRQDLHRPLIGNVERAAVKHAAFVHELMASSSVNCAVDTTATEQGGVCSIYDCINC